MLALLLIKHLTNTNLHESLVYQNLLDMLVSKEEFSLQMSQDTLFFQSQWSIARLIWETNLCAFFEQ